MHICVRVRAHVCGHARVRVYVGWMGARGCARGAFIQQVIHARRHASAHAWLSDWLVVGFAVHDCLPIHMYVWWLQQLHPHRPLYM